MAVVQFEELAELKSPITPSGIEHATLSLVAQCFNQLRYVVSIFKCSRFEVTLRLTASQSVCLGIEHSYWTCDQILLPVGMLLSEICGLVSVGRPLWREDGSPICSVITQWSESRRTRNHTSLPHLRLTQPGGPGSRIYIPQEHGGPVMPPDTGHLTMCYWTHILICKLCFNFVFASVMNAHTWFSFYNS
jgi:hypothetical protein